MEALDAVLEGALDGPFERDFFDRALDGARETVDAARDGHNDAVSSKTPAATGEKIEYASAEL